MNPDLWLTFVIASLLISLAPGAGMVNTLGNAARYGVRHSLPSILGLQLGLASQFLIVGIGLGAVLVQSEAAFQFIKWAGVLYLVWLGLQKWRQAPMRLTLDSACCELDYARRFREAALINLTNPKATVFLVALLPQFIDPARAQLPQLGILVATGLTIDALVMTGYAFLTVQATRWLRSEVHQRRFNRFSGGMFLLAAGLMAGYQHSTT